MIYDCFLFNNELEVLEIRLNELSDVVDKFVLVESTVTHTNKAKKLVFSQNKQKFKKFKDKIIHIVVKDTPDVTLPWIVNDFQFCQMMRGLKNCKPKDLIIFGDMDEIPKKEKIEEYNDGKNNLKIFEQQLCFYYLNNFEYANPSWLGTRMTTFSHFKALQTPWIAKFSKYDVKIQDAGWHFSYIGDIKRIQAKIETMTHQELNNARFNTPEGIKKAIVEQKDIFDLGYRFKAVDLSYLPEYVIDNPNKFSKYILNNDNGKLNNKMYIGYLNFKKNIRAFKRSI